jgi:hypothetical protein
MSRNLSLLISCALALAPQAGLAQDQPVPVYFEPSKEPLLNKAIMAALAQAPFAPEVRYTPGALVVAIPDKIAVEHLKVSGTTWTFTVTFSRNGDSLGQSVETCNVNRLSDCTDQLASDARSAAGMGQ